QVVIHQTTEALKLLVGDEKALQNKLVSFDLWKNEFVQMDIASLKDSDCPSCGSNATYPFLTFDEQTKAAILCCRESVQIRTPNIQDRNLQEDAKRLANIGGTIEVNEFLLSFTYDEERMVLFKDGRALIHGTNDINYAKTLYHRYFS